MMCGCGFQGPGWHGRSGVHTHMTNTRITDPEILERRFVSTGGVASWTAGDDHLSLQVSRHSEVISAEEGYRWEGPLLWRRWCGEGNCVQATYDPVPDV